jgi:hypothetical protein
VRTLQDEKIQLENKNRQLIYDMDYHVQSHTQHNRDMENLRRTLLELEAKNQNALSRSLVTHKAIEF